MRRGTWTIGVISLATCAVLGWAGCAERAPEPEPDAAGVESPAPVEVGPEMETALARADLADGAADHVVSRCTGCALAMEGKPEQTVQVGEYTLHFCSDRCRESFQKDPTTALLALQSVEEDEAAATP